MPAHMGRKQRRDVKGKVQAILLQAEEEALKQSCTPPPPPTQICPPVERLWASALTKLCQSEHSIALMNQWITLFIHDCPCQLFSVFLSPVLAPSPKIFMELFGKFEDMYMSAFECYRES